MPEFVWLASYPRSGNTWLRFLLSVYVYGEPSHWRSCNWGATDINWWFCNGEQDSKTCSNQILAKIVAYFDQLPESRYRCSEYFGKTHFKFDSGHPFVDSTSRIVHLVRHPKDILLSSLNFHRLTKSSDVSAEEYAKSFISTGGNAAFLQQNYGTWFENYLSWQKGHDYPTHLVRYEDLKRDTVGEFSQIIEFLGIVLDPQRVKWAVEQTRFENLRKLELAARSEKLLPDRDGHFFINKGQTGQLLSAIAPGLDRLFDERFCSWLEFAGYDSQLVVSA